LKQRRKDLEEAQADKTWKTFAKREEDENESL
jgi:hypothetical protein